MPQGSSGLNVNSWLQDFQENPLPPPDTWIGEFINSADLSTLHARSRVGMENHYKDKLTGEDGIIPTLLAFFSNFGLTLPEWLLPLEDLLVWLGETLTDTAQPLFETLLTFFDFLNTNLGVPLMEAISSFLGWLFTTFSGGIETLLKPAFEFLKWLMEQFSGEVNSLLKPAFEFLQWLLAEFSGSVETLLKPVFEFAKWLLELFDGTVDSLLKPAAQFLEWLFTLFDGTVDSLLKPAGEFIYWLFDLLGDSVETVLKPAAELIDWLFGLFAGSDVDNLLKPLFEFGKWVFTLFDESVESLLKPAFNWLKWLMASFGSSVGTFLEPVFEFLEWLWMGVAGGFGGFGATANTVLKPIFEWLDWLWTQFGSAAETFLKPVFGVLKTVWDAFAAAAGTINTTATAMLNGLFSFLSWLWTQFGAVEATFLRPVVNFFNWLWSGVAGGFSGFGATVDTVLKPIVEWLNWVWDLFGDGAGQMLRSLFQFFDWLWNGIAGGFAGFSGAVDTVLKPIFLFWDWLLSIFDTEGLAEIFATFKSLTDTFGNLTSWIGSIPDATAVLGIIQSITGFAVDSITEGFAKLVEWAQSIPLIGPMITALMGGWKNPLTGTNSTFADLVAWSKNQLGLDSAIPSFNLTGFIPDELMSLLPAGHVGNTQPNLVTDQAFSSDAAVQAGNGWSWDSVTTKPGSTGGSAKVACTGGVNQLFSNLIAVSPGQQLNVSASVKWTKTSPSSSPLISVGVRGYNGSEVKYTQTVASLTAAGASGGWTEISGNHTVPSNVTVTNVRLVLAVSNGPTGTLVWFDEAVMKKVSLISQTLVNELPGALNAKTSTASFQELLNKIARTTGASVAQVEAAVNSYLTGNSSLSGDKILSGNIDSAFIKDLVDTWDKVRFGVNGQVVQGSTSSSAATDLRNFTTSTSNLSSLINSNGVSIGSLTNSSSILGRRSELVESATSQLQTAVRELQTAVKDLQSTVNNTVRPAVTELQTGVNSVLKPAVTELQTTANTKTKTAITELQTAVNTVLKPAVTELQSNANTKVKPAITELQNAVTVLQQAQGSTPTTKTSVTNTTTTVPTTTTTTVTNTTTTVPTTTATTVTNTTGNVGTTPTAPVGTTAIPIVSVTDDFERVAASLGSAWTTRVNNPNGSVLGTQDGHNATFLPPFASTVSSAVVAVRYQTAAQVASSTPFQRISTTLSSSASRPLLGTAGYNDLIARANPANPLFGLVCRFYADGVVRIFYRLGAWESNPYLPSNLLGTFTSSIRPTTGTILEFFSGDKAAGDQTKLSARVGTALAGTTFINPAVLGSLGLGWGFGMGHGLSFAAPQAAAGLNYWAGQDQV